MRQRLSQVQRQFLHSRGEEEFDYEEEIVLDFLDEVLTVDTLYLRRYLVVVGYFGGRARGRPSLPRHARHSNHGEGIHSDVQYPWECC